MRNLMLATMMAVLSGACAPNPSECTEKGNDEACYKLCETGKEEFQSLCFMPRARKLMACADKDTDCATACTEWHFEEDTYRGYYKALIGTDQKVAAIDAKCAPFKK
jgi:hypothetical protein